MTHARAREDLPVLLYLASTSPARLALLRSSGIEPVVLPSAVDEDAVLAEASRHRVLSPAETVSLLAREKAEAVVESVLSAGRERGLVLGGDSMFELDGTLHGKPHTPERARERWLMQRGRTGVLHSGHWLIDVDPVAGVVHGARGAAAEAAVTFADDVSDDEIDAYVASGEPLAVAGAFTIDSLGAPFISSVSGDPSTVVGLSLPTLRRLVRASGHEWTALWNRRGAL
ncbi:septum formation inhibitor Maf [Labedella populi]|uniref:Nucleoside triphosphate pyrophosphatase n=1 Tax=Labedella populi TaxID=2498850 RepID=A0A3S4CF33_9MICO|nr:nucleoside triphosphate pyrophosphatase [Labedella populi]RWZ68510.1 septum formation inhibitor Maf [Labedella populi]